MGRVAFTLELFGRSIPIMWYGIVVTAGIVCSLLLVLFLGKKRGFDFDFMLELFIWVVVLAVVCCRLFYVVPRLGTEYHLDSWEGFLECIDIRLGGLTIIGGVFGGALGVLFCCLRNKKYSFAKVADCVVLSLLLGQIIGRWGNYFNQELFGKEILNYNWQWFPFAVYIDSLDGYYCALFFYEGVLNAIGLAAGLTLFFKMRDKLKPFTFSLLYLAWYGLVRGSLEFLKYEHAVFPGTQIGMVQVICYVMAAVSVILFILLQKGKIRFETKWFERQVYARAAVAAAVAEYDATHAEAAKKQSDDVNPIGGGDKK